MESFDARQLMNRYRDIADENENFQILKDVFIEDLPEDFDGEVIFQDILDFTQGEDIGEICAEFILVVNDGFEQVDFHEWEYDHLEFIIDLSNAYGFDLPAEFMNGLPEQLLLLVDAERVRNSQR